MAQALSLRTPFGPNVRIALVTGVSLALLGAVTIVLPLQRLSAVPVHETAAVQTFPKFKPRPVAAQADTPAEDSHDQLIAMTFDILQALSKEPISAGDQTFVISRPAAAAGAAETTSAVAEVPAADLSTAPKTRVVRTTAITIKPVTPLVIMPPAPVVETTAVASELDVDENVAAAEIAAEPALAPAPAAEAAPTANLRIVAGEGVNVRSGPGKSKDKLFALPGGAEVTIGANERGWLEITDAEGRTGWVYKDYLLTP